MRPGRIPAHPARATTSYRLALGAVALGPTARERIPAQLVVVEGICPGAPFLVGVVACASD